MTARDDYRWLAKGLLHAVKRAARLQLRYRALGIEVDQKSDDSPVTAADRASEEIILDALGQIAATIPVIAEEEVSAGRVPSFADTFFLVDALDGTKNFIKGRSDFTINVALVAGGVPRFGLILAPQQGLLCLTLGERDAFMGRLEIGSTGLETTDDGAADLDRLGLQRIRTREPDPCRLTVAVTNANSTGRLAQKLAKLPISESIETGSSIKFCRVADGSADFYPRLGSISEWDIAAGHAIVRAAGGDVTRWDGTALTYGQRDSAFRTPPFVAWGRTYLGREINLQES